MNPSLILLPSRYKAGTIYGYSNGAIVPTDVDRNSVAYRTAMSGLLEEMAAHIPRLDFWVDGCPMWLIEGQATNLLLRSEEFNGAYWVKAGTTVNSSLIISPNGTLTADKIEEAAGVTGTKQISVSLSQTAGAKAFSFFAKKDERTEVGIVTTGGGMSQHLDVFNIDDGALVSGNGAIFDYGNGWYRCVRFFTTLDNTSITLRVRPLVAGSNTYAGQLGFGIFIWGAQLETGSVATSYIKTTGSTATRLADNFTNALATDFIGQAQGKVTGSFYGDGLGTVLSLHDGTEDNMIEIYTDGAGRLIVDSYISGALEASLSSGDTILSGVNNYEIRYGAFGYQMTLNGVSQGQQSGGIPICSQYSLGSTIGTSNHYNGHVGIQTLYLQP